MKIFHLLYGYKLAIDRKKKNKQRSNLEMSNENGKPEIKTRLKKRRQKFE